jgi:carbonic anhydrase
MPSPSEALQRLKDGNQRYLADSFDPTAWGANRRQETLKPDSFPFAAVLACSDSRVPVELLFGQGIGDIFVVRSAGNRADNFGLASLDFAAALLHVSLIVVLGHTQCAAVKLALDNPPLPGKVPSVVDRVRGSLIRLRNQASLFKPDELYHKAIVHNTRAALEDVTHNCPMVRKRMVAGDLQVLAALYDLESGVVSWL